MKLRTVSDFDLHCMKEGRRYLRMARREFRSVGARKTYGKVCRAIRSADGAIRHGGRCNFVQSKGAQ